MKNKIKLLFVVCLLGTSFSVLAQEQSTTKQKTEAMVEEEEEKPASIFKFEPDYLASVENERAQQQKNREILDTLSISERKKKKLLKKMFKTDFTEHLSKTVVVDTEFEDDENE